MSHAGLPVAGTSLPSKFTVYSALVGWPSPPVPFELTLMPAPAAEMVMVCSFGTGPGSYFDLAGFSFQVPTAGSACANNDTAPMTTTKANIMRFIRHLLAESERGIRDWD